MHAPSQLPLLGEALAACQCRGMKVALFLQLPSQSWEERGSHSHLLNGRCRLEALCRCRWLHGWAVKGVQQGGGQHSAQVHVGGREEVASW